MILVPPDIYNDFQRRQDITTEPSLNLLIQLDKDMYNVLKKEGTEEEKIKEYNTILQQYLKVYSADVPKESGDETEMSEIAEPIHNKNILEHFSNRYRDKANKVLQLISKERDIIKITKDGSVLLRGKYVGNAVDFIYHMLKPNPPKLTPIGFEEFLTSLRELHFPASYITNTKVRRRYELKDIVNANDTDYQTDSTQAQTYSNEKVDILSTPIEPTSVAQPHYHNNVEWQVW